MFSCFYNDAKKPHATLQCTAPAAHLKSVRALHDHVSTCMSDVAVWMKSVLLKQKCCGALRSSGLLHFRTTEIKPIYSRPIRRVIPYWLRRGKTSAMCQRTGHLHQCRSDHEYSDLKDRRKLFCRCSADMQHSTFC